MSYIHVYSSVIANKDEERIKIIDFITVIKDSDVFFTVLNSFSSIVKVWDWANIIEWIVAVTIMMIIYND